MKGVKTKIVLPPFKAWFTFGEKLGNEGQFSLSSNSLVAYTGNDETKRDVMAVSYLKKGRYPSGNSIWGDPLFNVYKAVLIVDMSYEAVDGAVAYISDDLKLWRKAIE